jgi:hypothetical protein
VGESRYLRRLGLDPTALNACYSAQTFQLLNTDTVRRQFEPEPILRGRSTAPSSADGQDAVTSATNSGGQARDEAVEQRVHLGRFVYLGKVAGVGNDLDADCWDPGTEHFEERGGLGLAE